MRKFLLACMLLCVLPAYANADSRFLQGYGSARPPLGWLLLCQDPLYRFQDCEVGDYKPTHVILTPEALGFVEELNRAVNRMITPGNDIEIFGVVERWGHPQWVNGVFRGDCDEYVYAKRHYLLRFFGISPGALQMAVVKDPHAPVGEPKHLVLLLRTNEGEYVLDNMVDEVKHWSKTPYAFYVRQTAQNPNRWENLQPEALVSIIRAK